MWHDSFVFGTWLVLRIYDMTRPHIWHDSSAHVTWLVCTWDMTQCAEKIRHVSEDDWYMWHDSFAHGTWLICTWDMTYLHIGHDSMRGGDCSCLWEWQTCVTWLVYTRDMTRVYLWHDSFAHGTWLNAWRRLKRSLRMKNTRDMTRLYRWHDLSAPVTWLICTWDMTQCVEQTIYHRQINTNIPRSSYKGQYSVRICSSWLIILDSLYMTRARLVRARCSNNGEIFRGTRTYRIRDVSHRLPLACKRLCCKYDTIHHGTRIQFGGMHTTHTRHATWRS